MTAPGSSSGSEFGAARVGEQAADALAWSRAAAPATGRRAPPRTTRPRPRRRACSCPRAWRPTTETTASTVAAPPKSSTDTRRKSRNLTARRAPRAPACMPPHAVDDEVRACSTISAGPSSERTPTRHGVVQLARVDQRGQGRERVEVGHVVAGVQRRARPATARAAPARRGPCRSAPAAGSRAPCAPSGSHRPSASASAAIRSHARVGGLLVGRAAPVEAHDRALVLDPDAQRAQLRRVALAREPLHAAGPGAKSGITRASRLVGLEQLGAVEPGVGDPAHAHQPAHLGRRAAGDAGHAARSGATAAPSSSEVSFGHAASCGALDDRRERAVHVEEQRRPRGVGRDWA